MLCYRGAVWQEAAVLSALHEGSRICGLHLHKALEHGQASSLA